MFFDEIKKDIESVSYEFNIPKIQKILEKSTKYELHLLSQIN